MLLLVLGDSLDDVDNDVVVAVAFVCRQLVAAAAAANINDDAPVATVLAATATGVG